MFSTTCAWTWRPCEGAGPNVDLLLDVNFNAKTEGYLKILREIALRSTCSGLNEYSASRHGLHPPPEPHSSSLLRGDPAGPARVHALFREQGDGRGRALSRHRWNGVWQSMKSQRCRGRTRSTSCCTTSDGHLCTMMNAHFAAAVPNLRIMETDIDRLCLGRGAGQPYAGLRKRPPGVTGPPGLGYCNPTEAAIRARPPQADGGCSATDRNPEVLRDPR